MAAESCVGLIDYPYQHSSFRWRRVMTLFFIILVVGVIFGIVAGAFAGPGKPLSLIVVAIGAGLAVTLIGLAVRSEGKRIERLARGCAQKPIVEFLDQVTAEDRMEWGILTASLPAVLVEQGRIGVCIRMCKLETAPDIDPLSVDFEPIPVDESVPHFLDLERTGHRDSTAVPTALVESAMASTDVIAGRRIRRNFILIGGWLFIGIFGFNFLMAAVQAIGSGRISFSLVMWACYLGLAISGIGGRGAWRVQQQWLLVPGGLAIRNSSWRSRGWSLHLFERTKSALIIIQKSRGIWTALVADAIARQQAGVTAREANMILRAWLSPLPPPALDRLSDLE